MLVGAVLVRFFSFSSTPLFLLFFNHVVFLLSASRSINCAASSERTIAIIVCMFCGPIVLAHGCYMTREFRRERAHYSQFWAKLLQSFPEPRVMRSHKIRGSGDENGG